MHDYLTDILQRRPELAVCFPTIQTAFDLLHETVSGSGKILTCGNGGSAADSEHIVGELMKGFLLKRPVPVSLREQLREQYGDAGEHISAQLQGAIPAISLVSQTALITAYLNDVDGAMIFAQQVLGYGKTGDSLIALSTSGNSANVVNAVRVAGSLGVHTIGMTGKSGGIMRELCEVCICAPAAETAYVQEYHQVIYHALCAALEAAFFQQ